MTNTSSRGPRRPKSSLRDTPPSPRSPRVSDARRHLASVSPPATSDAEALISIPVWASRPPAGRPRAAAPSAIIEVLPRVGPTELRFEVRARHGVPGVPSVAPLSLRSTLAHARGPRQAVAVLLAEVAEYYHNEGAGDCGPAVVEAMLERFAGQG